MEGYRIADEPKAGGLAQLVVNPVFPLLAIMFGGVWLAFPWGVLNGFAMGSANRWRELAVVLVGWVVQVGIVFGALVLGGMGLLPEIALPYVFIGRTVIGIAVAYQLYVLQAPSFALHRYYGGTVRNGLPVIVIGFLVRPRLLEAAPLLLTLVLM